MRLAALYTLLALIATVANLLSQAVAVRLWFGPWPVEVAMLVGTGVGLVVKYVLDKIYIFRFTAQNAAHDLRTFLLYAGMGVATTLIFWGFEFAFYRAFEDKNLRYLGGAIGLAIGYWTKYRLDKRFVFRPVAPDAAS